MSKQDVKIWAQVDSYILAQLFWAFGRLGFRAGGQGSTQTNQIARLYLRAGLVHVPECATAL